MKNPFLFCLLLALSTTALAFIPEGDGPYYTLENERISVIYSQGKEALAKEVGDEVQRMAKLYDEEFRWEMDERPSLVLVSPNDQTPNAFATVLPFHTMAFYSGLATQMDRFAVRSIGKLLAHHELAHIYQLGAKRGLSKVAKKIFGNNPITFLPFPWVFANPITTVPFPIFTNPNILLPRWILEGNAVFNESRFGNGGRLFSGEFNALFYALLRDGKVSVDSLTNQRLEFPFGRMDYVVGGHLFQWISKKYGISKANQFFALQSFHYFWPLILSDTFESLYGRSYAELIEDFIEETVVKASQQNASRGKVLLENVTIGPLNRNGGEVLFLADDLKGSPQLIRVINGVVRAEDSYLPSGKVFTINDRIYSAALGTVSPEKKIWSLWDENGNRLERYDAKFLLDAQNGHQLEMDMERSFDRPYLLLNGQNWGPSDSNAILDDNGSIYHIAHEDKRRTLYKDKTALCSWPGHYGKIADVRAEEIFFIAATEFGSSLFSCRKGETPIRRSLSDLVVDAKIIGDDMALITEVYSEGHRLVQEELSSAHLGPFVYRAFFEKERPKLLDEPQRSLAESSSPKRYGTLSELQFSSWQGTYTNSPDGEQASVQALWVDPLLTNQFSLAYLRDEVEKRDRAFIDYAFIKYRLDVGVGIIASKYAPYESDSNKEKFLGGRLNFSLPSIWWPRFSWINTLELGSEDFDRRHYGLFSSTWTYERPAPLSLRKNPFFRAAFQALEDHEGSFFSLDTRGQIDARREDHLGGDLFGSWSTRDDLVAGESASPLSTSLLGTELLEGANDYYSAIAGVDYRKTIEKKLYGSWFPVGIRRSALGLRGQYRIQKAIFSESWAEAGPLFETELLLFHMAPVKAELRILYRLDGSGENTSVFSVGGVF